MTRNRFHPVIDRRPAQGAGATDIHRRGPAAAHSHAPAATAFPTRAHDATAAAHSSYVALPTIFGVSLLALGMAVVGCGTDDGPPSPGPRTEARVVETPPAPPEPEVAATVAPATPSPASRTTAPSTKTSTRAVSPRATFADAESLYTARRYGDAADAFRAYLETHPQNAGANYLLGLSLWKSGSPRDAEEPLRAAAELDPDAMKARLNLVRVLLDLDRAREATEVAAAVTQARPDLSEGYRLLGRARHENGDADGAVEAYREALRRDPHDVWSMNNLGMVRIDQGFYEEALPPLARAVELRGDSPVFRNNLGAALERSGYLREALVAYETAAAADSTYSRAVASAERLRPLVPAQSREPFDFDRAAADFESWIAEPEHAAVSGPPLPVDPE